MLGSNVGTVFTSQLRLECEDRGADSDTGGVGFEFRAREIWESTSTLGCASAPTNIHSFELTFL
jgi:hypothetical protein